MATIKLEDWQRRWLEFSGLESPASMPHWLIAWTEEQLAAERARIMREVALELAKPLVRDGP